MRLVFSLVTLVSLVFGGWYAWKNVDPIRQFVQNQLQSGELNTLEIRHSAEEIMQTHKTELLKNTSYSFLEPKLLFYPYLLMDVKFSKNAASTAEGILLWGLNDGEMVLHTTSWEKTHGFEDCLAAKADKNDFKILEVLVENGGSTTKEKIYNSFKIDQEMVDLWIENCKSKKLIVASGNKLRLHFQQPRLQTEPLTHFEHPLVTQPTRFSQKVKERYSASQVKHLALIAFGNDFAIRRTQEVFLPVYRIAIQNPDGSTFTTYWNAHSGQKLDAAACR